MGFAQKPFVTTQGKCQSHLHLYSKMTIKLQLELLIIICKPKIHLVNTQCKTQHMSAPHILKQFKPYHLENHSISSRKQAWKLERISTAKWKPLWVPCPTYQCPKVPPWYQKRKFILIIFLRIWIRISVWSII